MREYVAEMIPYVFQPIYKTSTVDEIIGYEALARPYGLSPEQYIRQVREAGSLEQFEFETFFNAITQFKKRKLSGKLFINSFPYISLERKKLEYLKKLSGELYRDIYIENLEYGIEVNEGLLLDKYGKLKDLGFKVAVDDFGCGINSVKVLRLIEPEIVKIDRSFITGCDENKTRMNMVEIIMDSIRSHKSSVLAEGVETKEEYEYLKEAGADYMQGYYLGRPE